MKVTPVTNWEIGLSYRPPVTAELDGTYKAYTASGTQAGNEKVTLVVPLPQIIRSGVRFVQPRWDTELDIVLELARLLHDGQAPGAGVVIGSGGGGIDVAPLTRHGEVLEREADGVDHAVALVATRLFAVLFEAGLLWPLSGMWMLLFGVGIVAAGSYSVVTQNGRPNPM